MADMSRGGRVYLLVAGNDCVLFDTGAPDGTLGASELIQSAGRRPEQVRLIVLTHSHPGHAGNAAGLRTLTGAPVACSAAAAEALRSPQPERRRGLRRMGRVDIAPAVPVQRTLRAGEAIDLCGGIEVIDAPGHGGGSLAFHLPAVRTAVLGDAASVTRAGLAAPPRGACEDAVAAAATVARLAPLEVRCLAPGHGYPMIDGRLPGRRGG